MKRFIIERILPGVGKLTPVDLKAISIKSNEVIHDMEASYHWIQTYVTDNKIYCFHIAPDAETVMQHAQQSGFPADIIAEVKCIIDPSTSA
jgi:hypothetical protein